MDLRAFFVPRPGRSDSSSDPKIAEAGAARAAAGQVAARLARCRSRVPAR